MPSLLLERRPDLIEAEQTLVAANARDRRGARELLPAHRPHRRGSARLSTELSRPARRRDRLLVACGGQALGPIFTFGQTTYTLAAPRRPRATASRAAYEQRGADRAAEVSDALIAREKLVAVRSEQEREVAALRESRRHLAQRYLGGLATYLEVLDAQQQLFPAEFDARADASATSSLAVVALYRALGGGWNAYDAEPELPLPLAP